MSQYIIFGLLHRASEKIRSTPGKTFFNSIDPKRHFAAILRCNAAPKYRYATVSAFGLNATVRD